MTDRNDQAWAHAGVACVSCLALQRYVCQGLAAARQDEAEVDLALADAAGVFHVHTACDEFRSARAAHALAAGERDREACRLGGLEDCLVRAAVNRAL
jgi:hypothetical protein